MVQKGGVSGWETGKGVLGSRLTALPGRNREISGSGMGKSGASVIHCGRSIHACQLKQVQQRREDVILANTDVNEVLYPSKQAIGNGVALSRGWIRRQTKVQNEGRSKLQEGDNCERSFAVKGVTSLGDRCLICRPVQDVSTDKRSGWQCQSVIAENAKKKQRLGETDKW